MILVTGCNGVLGSAFKKINKSKEFYYLSGRKVNLCSQNETNNFFKKISGVIHLAAVSGGLGLSGQNIGNPLEIIHLCYLIF